MTPEKRTRSGGLTDEAMDQGMGRLLQAGVLLASAVVLGGGLLYLHANGGRLADYRRFAGERPELRQWTGLLGAVRHGEAAAVIQVGILLLIATPVARVIFAGVAFAVQRDWMYLGISVAVLAVLLLGMFRFG